MLVSSDPAGCGLFDTSLQALKNIAMNMATRKHRATENSGSTRLKVSSCIMENHRKTFHKINIQKNWQLEKNMMPSITKKTCPSCQLPVFHPFYLPDWPVAFVK